MNEPYCADLKRNEAAYRLLDKIAAHISWGGYDDRPAFLLSDGTPVTQGELRAAFWSKS